MTWDLRDLVETLSLVTLLLAFKFVVTNVIWGARKGRAGQRAPEDGAQNNAAPTAEDIARAERAGRVVQNDLENIPIALITFIVATICISTVSPIDDDYEDYVQAVVAFLIAFCAARYLHSIVYLLGLPHMIRTLFWLIGTLAFMGAGIVAVIAAFDDDSDSNNL